MLNFAAEIRNDALFDILKHNAGHGKVANQS